LQFAINDELFFDVLLMGIRGKRISVASKLKTKHGKEAEKTLLSETGTLEQRISQEK